MTGVMAIKLVSIEVQRSGSMLRSSSCVPHCGLADTFRTPPSIFSRAPHISVRRNELLSPTPVVF
jgi:hypothetical protein